MALVDYPIYLKLHLRAFKNNHPNQFVVVDHILMKDGKKRGSKHKFYFRNFYDQSTTTEILIFTYYTIYIGKVHMLFDESEPRAT
jgi:hypothetical protein